jgi:hypothetical protein
MIEPITDLKSFENALDVVMTLGAEAGLTAEQIESTMKDYAEYARMYTGGDEPDEGQTTTLA